MGEHRSLREAGRSARVQQPCGGVLVQILGRFLTGGTTDHVGIGRIAGRAGVPDHDDMLDCGHLGQEWRDQFKELGLHQQNPCFGVAEDPRPFTWVEPVVEERQRHSRGGNAVVALDVFRKVLGQDGDAVARAGNLAHGIGDAPGRGS